MKWAGRTSPGWSPRSKPSSPAAGGFSQLVRPPPTPVRLISCNRHRTARRPWLPEQRSCSGRHQCTVQHMTRPVLETMGRSLHEPSPAPSWGWPSPLRRLGLAGVWRSYYLGRTLICWHRRKLKGICHEKSRAKRRLTSHAQGVWFDSLQLFWL